MLAEGAHCEIWVERNCGVDEDQAQEVADHFDEVIFPKMINAFSLRDIKDGNDTYDNVIEFASSIITPEGKTPSGKLCILLLDIKDGYNGITNRSYVAGYFWMGNFFSRSQVSSSNERSMIFVDTNPGMDPENIEGTYKTLAHEMQHLMNFATTVLSRSIENSQGQITKLNYMDTWVDEGLAAAAEWVYSGEYSEDRIEWFKYSGSQNGSMKGLINKGNNFFVWNNRSKESQYAVLDDYATVNIFFQWLRLQTNESIYRSIITSKDNDYNAVTKAFNAAASRSFTWDELLKTWLAANYINNSTGLYGYKNDSELKDIRIPAPASIAANIQLAPGEGVYSRMTPTTATMPAQSGSIRYASLSKQPLEVGNTAANGRVLLTYNVNTLGTSLETGITTGSPILANTVTAGRSASPAFDGPYRIGATNLQPINVELLGGLNLRKGKNSDE